MIMSVLPLKKLRRNGRCLFGVILMLGLVAVFHEFVAAAPWSSSSSSLGRELWDRPP